MNLLIVEYHKMSSLLLKKLTSKLRCIDRCEVVRTSVDAIRKISGSEWYDLVLIDIDMPDSDPYSVLDFIRYRNFTTRLLALCDKAERTVINHLVNCGAFGCITKTEGIRELEIALNQVHKGHYYFSASALEAIAVNNHDE